ncbi:MAG: nucleotide exchange factor GrpE [Gemmatimonadota bacterium]
MTSNDPTTGRTSTSSEEAEGRETPGEVEKDEESGADEAGATGSFEAEAAELQADFDALNDRHLRLAAEFDNFRRRAQNEMRESWARAQADLVRRLVDSLDDLQRVADIDPETTTVPALIEGLELVERKLFRALEDAGVEAIDPAGAPFDPESMEAVMRVPADSEDEDDHVDQVFQKGYRLKGQLVRPARVSVRKHE